VRSISSLLVAATAVALSLSGCKTYVEPRGSPAELATIRGNGLSLFAQHGNTCNLAFIDGGGNALGGYLIGGKQKLTPGRHTITVDVHRHDVPQRGSFVGGSTQSGALAIGIALDILTMGIPASGEFATCSFELDAEPGHDYVVSDIANVQLHPKYRWVTTLEFKVTSTTADGQSSTALVPAKCDSTPPSSSAKGQVAPAPDRVGVGAYLPFGGSTAPAAAISSQPKIGDRWIYQLSDRGRVRGMVDVEIVETSAAGVKERITREGYPAFMAERRVEVNFNTIQFQPPIVLPGGYPLWEIAPYLPLGTQLSVGWQSWGLVPGEFYIPGVGTQTLAARVSVASQTKVSVPAGEFDTWTVETEPLGSFASYAVIKCTFWYSPQSLRTVKMRCDTVPNSWGQPSSEVYELSRFEPAK
jgi:hypothetical protein